MKVIPIREILTECLSHTAAAIATTREFIVMTAMQLLQRDDLGMRFREAVEQTETSDDILRCSIKQAAVSICGACNVETAWTRSRLVASASANSHIFTCPKWNCIGETKTAVKTSE